MRGADIRHPDLGPALERLAPGQPYVSEGTAAWWSGGHVVVMAMPTRDVRGRLTGVLAAAVLPRPLAITRGSLDLGDSGVSILDRKGRSVLAGYIRPSNLALVRTLKGTGARADSGAWTAPRITRSRTPRPRYPAGRS